MKKLFAFFVLVVMSTSVHAQKYHYDVNGDGTVNVSDVTTFVNNILGVPNGGEEEQNYVYDVNGDGTANVTDVMCLVNKILGILDPGEDTKPCLTCPDDHHPHMIDLGLPSGTMWACCNVDTENPENQSPANYGGYYAWGETEEKASYSWANYTHCEGIEGTSRPIGDDIAGTEYDVAHVKWGGAWVIPSLSQFNELINNCTSQSTTMDDVVGRIFIGPSGGTIFLPAAGYRWGEDCVTDGEYGYYWSSTQNPSSSDISFILILGNSHNVASRSFDYRFSGISVRPASFPNLILSNSVVSIIMGVQKTVDIVSGTGSYTVASSDPGVATAVIDDNSVIVTAMGMGKATITVTDVKTGQTVSIEVAVFDSISLSTTSLHLVPGAVETVEITSGSGSYSVACSDEKVTTAAVDGTQITVKARDLGHVVITVTDLLTGIKAMFEVNVTTCPDDHHPHLINLGLPSGTKWACCNKGADKPEDFGGYYKLGAVPSAPSLDQIKELLDKCSYSWTTLNGVIGGKFTGPNGGLIFLPAAGYVWNGELYGVGSYGNCWSSTPYDDYFAYILYFDSSNAHWYSGWYDYRYVELTVRPVR